MSNTRRGTTDLTVGRPLTQILLFAIPLIGGTLFQQLYSFADTVIVGRCLGANALAAVGATYSLNFLILGFVQGACVGFGIPLAQSFGARDPRELHRYLWNGMWLSMALCALFTLGTVLLTDPLLKLIHTPEDIFSMASGYIRVIFLGIPATVAYNYSASALRAMGDSRHPFYYLIATSLLNIVLDYLFIVPFRMGVEGAALATVLSQAVSAVLNFWQLFCRTQGIRIRKEEMGMSAGHLGRLAIVGLPMGFEYSVSAVGAVIMQNAINALGSGVVAAQTAGEKVRQMFTLPMESVGMAMATYVGQNLGARRLDRIRAGIRDGLLIQAVYCILSFAVIALIKGWAVGLVLGDSPDAILSDAVLYLGTISTLFILHGSLMIFRNTLQGMGYSTLAIVSGFGELAGRWLGSTLSTSFGFLALCYANPMAWGISLVFCAVSVTMLLKAKNRQMA